MLLILFLAYFSTQFSSAAPISSTTNSANATTPSNTTASSQQIAPSWVSEPPGRGTWNLLYSCVFALVLCVWTSVHLNIPGYGENAWQMYRRKAKWVATALFAPEFVVYCAFQQWFTARMFLKELQKLHDWWVPPGSESKGNGRKQYKFDMAYAMLKRATLTTNGLLLLGQHGHFFYVEPDAIADKSKANILAKGLVCVQVLWVAGQTIERKVVGLPISILEYHTLVHVVCALIMYVLWFQKPYDIQYPTLVATDDCGEALAFIVASSLWKGYSGFTYSGPKNWADWLSPSGFMDEDPVLTWYGSPTSPDSTYRVQAIGKSTSSAAQDQSGDDYWYPALPDHDRAPARKTTIIYSPVCQKPPAITLSSGQALRSGLGPSCYLYTSQRIDLSAKDKTRLDSAASFISKILELLDEPHHFPPTTFNDPRLSHQKQWRKTPLHRVFQPGIIRRYGRNLIAYRAQNTAGWRDLTSHIGDGAAKHVLFVALGLVLAAYGAIHLVAGHTTFPSMIELTLWKLSCYTLLGGVGLVAMPLAVIEVFGEVEIPDRLGEAMLVIVILVILPLLTLLYTFARVFIVLESFISLRHMPAGVYQTPNLSITSYIPHL